MSFEEKKGDVNWKIVVLLLRNMKEGNGQEELPSSPYRVLQQISEEAVRVAGEALQNVYSSSSSKFSTTGVGHRRSRSETVTSSVQRSGSNFTKWKSQMQKTLRNWGSTSQEDSSFLSFNPEVLANQKRQWYQLHSKTSVCFLHFGIWTACSFVYGIFWKEYSEMNHISCFFSCLWFSFPDILFFTLVFF